MGEVWETVARDLMDELDVGEEAVDAFELARDCGFDVVPGAQNGRGRLIGDRVIQIDASTSALAQRCQVAIELGRWALFRFGEEICEEGARYVGLALMLPRHCGCVT